MTGPAIETAVPTALTIQEAVFAVGLHRYVAQRLDHGERVGRAVVDRIVAIAATAGIHPAVDLRLFGFRVDSGCVQPLPPEVVQRATDQIERTGGAPSLRKLWDQLNGRSVADLERMAVCRLRC